MDEEEVEKIKGRCADCAADPPGAVSWRFYPAGRKKKLTEEDIVGQLQDYGMCGWFGEVIHVPEERHPDYKEWVDLYEVEAACEIFAELSGYTVYDRWGKLAVKDGVKQQ